MQTEGGKAAEGLWVFLFEKIEEIWEKNEEIIEIFENWKKKRKIKVFKNRKEKKLKIK